ncbi:SusC/RagA family TonB-linked outer membrane protein [Pedobacter sp. BS3]|uniref:SusC/RagA family TonB-linked outer membrane protein n=1 Tax=Pedobacter sp. BS3 TaxID=2567937 RepID=UPI0011EDE226|nr:SusC/RagA family TonB-linked outer membrane protein [Pedobacter sp. BS3]TZF81348.1 SusC/RagA family TonB-linked outer membrane protein [Pedobacter sp. BS3]
MKLTVVLLVVVLVNVKAASYAQNVSLQVKNGTIEEVFNKLRQETGYDFLYDAGMLKDIKRVSVSAKNSSLSSVLDQCLAGESLTYTINKNTVVIKRAEATERQLTVSGKVTDTKNNPLPGVSILIKGTQTSTISDYNGNYKIAVPNANAVLVFTYLGFERKEVPVSGKAMLNVSLIEKVTDLNEVVVTALGITREEKALGYAATVVKGEDLTEALSNNWTDALSGKVAGLNLIRSNSGPTGSNKIILRGENNLSGGNDALIVVDGVVINNGSGRMTGYSGAYLDETVVDYGSGLDDINPEDIENVTVLKGPGAAALYGQRGANGAIIITTKSGKPNQKGLGITLNSNTSFATINRIPNLQYEYGQGDDGANYYSYGTSEDGVNTSSTTKAFGPKFNGQLFYQYDPTTHTRGATRTPWVPYKNGGFNDFFVTGKTFTNSLSLDGGTDKTSARFSLTNVNNSWIVPNTGYERNTVALSVNSKPTKKLQIASKINYTNKYSNNLPAGGYNNQSIMYGYIFWQPSAPISWLRDYWLPGKEDITQNTPLTGTPDNPYLISYEMLNKQSRNSVTGSISATYDITKELNLMVRTSIDFASDSRSQQRPFDTEKFRKGFYRTQDIYSQELNSDFLFKYKKNINKDVDISASVGGSMLRNTYGMNQVRADSLLYPGIFTMANSAGPLWTQPFRSKYAINSLYGLVTGAYKNFLFLDFTLRNDWNSVLATPTSKGNVSFIYPSVNASLILSEIFKLPNAISYTKLRGSYAGVGSGETNPYRTNLTFSADPLYPGGALYNPSTLNNPYLKPLYTTSYEAGLEMKFFRSRVGFDLTLYTGNTKDQILKSSLGPSSGSGYLIVNAGSVRNRGIELALNGSPFKSKKGLTWTVNATFSANQNTIMALTDSLQELVLQNGPGSNGFIIARPGGSMGDLYGRGYERSPDGQIVYNNGSPVIGTELLYLGNTMPKWKASLQNQFRYKNFSASFMFDAQYGSVAYSLTQGKMAVQGKTTATLPGRYNGIVGDGVVLNPDGSYSPNTVVNEDLSTYYDAHFGTSNVEGSTFSTDFIKLREARLDYTFKAKTLKRIGLQKATVGLYGRDLFIFSKWPGFDPEFGTLSGSDINRGFEIGQFPSTRTYGLNLTVGF